MACVARASEDRALSERGGEGASGGRTSSAQRPSFISPLMADEIVAVVETGVVLPKLNASGRHFFGVRLPSTE